MSASVYANPYIYKPPPVRIDYPGLFDGFRNCSFRYIMDSKILALAVLILGAATFVVLLMLLLPFWFKLVLDPVQGTFGSEPVKMKLDINTGLFYMRETDFDNTVFLDKYTNTDTVPSVIQAAQVFSIVGTCLLVACFSASIILMFRRFASVTALLMLAGASSLAALCQVLVIIACAALIIESSCDPYGGGGCNYHDNLEWNLIPIYSQFYRVEPSLTPYVQPNWAFYIAILGALISCAGAAMVWVEACMTSSKLRQIRYQQLKEHRDPYEKEENYTGEKFKYQPPVQRGPNAYGMQPVVIQQGHAYEGMVINPEPRQAYMPPPTFHPRGGPPSSTGSYSEPREPTREINL